jgi:hypothetical protein
MDHLKEFVINNFMFGQGGSLDIKSIESELHS